MGNKFKIVEWAKNEVEAEIFLSLLRDYDIPCKKLRESFGAMNSLSYGIFGEIAIAVPDDRIEDARSILDSFIGRDLHDEENQ